jgi:hypothetical protein
LGISDDWIAYQVDGLVYSFGAQLSSALKGVEGKNKREIENKTERLLAKWLDQEVGFRKVTKPGEGA